MRISNLTNFRSVIQLKRKIASLGNTSQSGLPGVTYAGKSGLTAVAYTNKSGLPGVGYNSEYRSTVWPTQESP
jgi:hypothetical protein